LQGRPPESLAKRPKGVFKHRRDIEIKGALFVPLLQVSFVVNPKIALSRDGGQTWSPTLTDATLIEPVCQASLLRHPADNDPAKDVFLFSNPASQTARTNGTVRLSRDQGKSWPVARVLYPGSFAYSCLATLPDGAGVGCLFERDGTTKISLARFTQEWLTGQRIGKPPPPRCAR
jgi:hypothetical protein